LSKDSERHDKKEPKERLEPISLYPLTPEEALEAFMETAKDSNPNESNDRKLNDE